MCNILGDHDGYPLGNIQFEIATFYTLKESTMNY